jgi:hypothetical protein
VGAGGWGSLSPSLQDLILLKPRRYTDEEVAVLGRLSVLRASLNLNGGALKTKHLKKLDEATAYIQAAAGTAAAHKLRATRQRMLVHTPDKVCVWPFVGWCDLYGSGVCVLAGPQTCSVLLRRLLATALYDSLFYVFIQR